MADLPQVERALAQRIASTVYPDGTGAPSAIAAPVKIYRGWPDPDTLTRDLKAGMAHITIFARGGVSNAMPDAHTRWEDDPRPDPSMTVEVAPDEGSVTFAGTGSALMLIAVVADDSEAWTYAADEDDTPESVAAALAALVSVDRAAEASGATLTIPGITRLGASVAVGGRQRRRIRTQRQGLQVTMWCPTPAMRDDLSGLLDLAIAEEARLPVSDGSIALLHYNGTMSDDGSRADPLYRRDLLLSVDYDTVLTRIAVAPIVVVPVPIAPVPDVTASPALVKTVLVNTTAH